MKNIEHLQEPLPENPSKKAAPEKAHDTYIFKGGMLTHEIGKYDDDVGVQNIDDEI